MSTLNTLKENTENTEIIKEKENVVSKNHGVPSTALEASTMDLIPDNGILNGLKVEIEVQNILSLTSALPDLDKI